MISNTVISICSKGHLDVWKHTSKLLPKYLSAQEYIVYVPAREIALFRKNTNPLIKVQSQEELSSKFFENLRKELQKANHEERFGWYLQQFLKIEAVQRISTQIVTIWDADCVPVSNIEILNEKDQIVYVDSSRELHPPYFENIGRLLHMIRTQKNCFVIPSFPMKSEWVTEFIKYVEEIHDTHWSDAIIKCTDFKEKSGFSETETLGTWVANTHPSEWVTRPGTWERYGQSRFGYARKLKTENIELLGKRYGLEIITFENWDKRGLKLFIKRLVRLYEKWKSF